MRRITVFQRDTSWCYEPVDQVQSIDYTSALDAAIAAGDYAETLRGAALGYIIRLHVKDFGSEHVVTLDTEVF